MQRLESGTEERFLYGSFDRQVLHIKDPRRRYERRNSSYRSDREMDIGTMQRSVAKRRREQQRAYGRLDSIVTRYIDLLAAPLPDTTGPADNQSTEAPPPLDLNQEAEQTREELRQQWRLIDNREARINEFQVEIHKKFSIPVACLVFALIGAPLGALIRRRGAAVSVGVSIFFFWIYCSS